MKPIAQTFYINEPENGVAGVHVTSVELFFQSKSPIFGVQVQLRQTNNGEPTKYVLAGADVTLSADSINVSDDASLATKFIFPAPIFLQSLNSYALIIIPVGNNPDYKIWTSELAPGTIDVTTNTPIKTNNDTGALFLSSNDRQFTAIDTEDIKFNINIANFTSTSGKAVFTTKRSDYVAVRNKIGSFYPREKVVVSNNSFNLVRFTITSNTAAFTNGETLFQRDNGGANVATGIIFSANTSTIKITNSNGTWSSSYQVKGSTSNSNGIVSGVFANVITVNGSNTITVPFTNNVSVDQMIYVGTDGRSYMQPSVVKSIINGTTLQVADNINFDSTTAMYGRVRGDGYLYASIKIEEDPLNPNFVVSILDNVTSNNTINFSRINNRYIMGTVSGASTIAIRTYNSNYNTIVPQFAEVKPPGTDNIWSFIGTASSDKSVDSNPILLDNFIEKELYDFPRTLMSRSNEYSQLDGIRKGDTTLKFYADMGTSNNMISPVIDYASRTGVFLNNRIVPREKLYGYRVSVDNNLFVMDDVVVQQNSATGFIVGKGTVSYTYNNLIFITNITGIFNDNYTIQLESDNTVNTNVVDYRYFSEKTNTNYQGASRYISKSVILAEKQDAEDIRVFLTAYRPATTDFLIYARFLNGNDGESISNKPWTLLEERSSPALLSSTANKNDFVELEYGLPTSIELFADSCSCNSTSTTVTIRSNDDVSRDNYIYFADTQSSKFFVGRVISVDSTNKKQVYLKDIPPFSIANASFGVIPTLEHPQGAFIYSKNNNIIKYVSSGTNVYDSYKTFAIKIVPVSDSTSLVPRAKDMRAIALQV